MPDATTPAPRFPDAAALARWLPLAVWVVSVANALAYLDRGWFPHDLGSVAHPAQRVLLGELPHRDFDDVYTGGLAFLNALGFRLLGESAMAARWVALGAFSLWVPAAWGVARAFAGPWAAAAATLLAAAWTLPMYAEGMPSWYNLFLATFALLALVRFAGDARPRWLFWGGVAVGASILFKIIGLYAVAAALLGLAWLEDASRPEAGAGAARGTDVVYRWFIAACALALVAGVVGLVARGMGPEGLVRFAVPAASAPLVMAWAVRRHSGVPSHLRFRALMGMSLPFTLGVAAVVAPFLLLYAFSGALGDLYRGVFVLPQRRLADAAWTGLRGGLAGMAVAAAAVSAVAFGPGMRTARGRMAAGVAAVVGAAALAASGVPRVYLALWQGLWWLPPFAAAAGAVALLRRGAGTHAFLVLAAYGLASLVEVPFAAPIYFFFAAPLLVLLGLALAEGPRRQGWLVGLVCFLLAFTALRLNPGFVRHLGLQPARHDQTEALRIPRGGGLRVDAEARDEVETVVGMVEALAGGPYIYATPDSPELYVLTGRRNPTRTLFEFLDPDPETRVARVLEALDRTGVRIVVISRRPLFSGAVSPELVAGLQARYPMAREVGRFLVVWKSPGPPSNPDPRP